MISLPNPNNKMTQSKEAIQEFFTDSEWDLIYNLVSNNREFCEDDEYDPRSDYDSIIYKISELFANWFMTLSQDQLSKLIQLYAEQVVDSMDVRDLCAFAIDTICDNMDGLSEDEIKTEIEELYDHEMLADLLESVTAD